MDQETKEDSSNNYIFHLLSHDSARNTIDWQDYVKKTPTLVYKRPVSLQNYLKRLVITINNSPLDPTIKSVCIKYLNIPTNVKLTRYGVKAEYLGDLNIKGLNFTNRQKFMILQKAENLLQSMLKWTNFKEIVEQIPQLHYPRGFRNFLLTIKLPEDTTFNDLDSIFKIYLVKLHSAKIATFFTNTTALKLEKVISAENCVSEITVDNADSNSIETILKTQQENVRKIISKYGRDLVLSVLFIKEEALKLGGYDRYFFIKLVWEELESCLDENRVFDKTIFQFKPNPPSIMSKNQSSFHESLESLVNKELKQLRR